MCPLRKHWWHRGIVVEKHVATTVVGNTQRRRVKVHRAVRIRKRTHTRVSIEYHIRGTSRRRRRGIRHHNQLRGDGGMVTGIRNSPITHNRKRTIVGRPRLVLAVYDIRRPTTRTRRRHAGHQPAQELQRNRIVSVTYDTQYLSVDETDNRIQAAACTYVYHRHNDDRVYRQPILKALGYAHISGVIGHLISH